MQNKLHIHIITPYRTVFRYTVPDTGSLIKAYYRLARRFEEAPNFAYVRFLSRGGCTIAYSLGDHLHFDTWRMVDSLRDEILNNGRKMRFSELDSLYASYRLGTDLLEFERKWREAHEAGSDV